MLKQPQKKIMSVKDFTNRLTYFSNALEECARAYENTTAGDRVKRYDTRDGFGMLLFCPPKPTDDHQKIYDNIVCHWFYRQQLREAEENAQAAAKTLNDAEVALADAESAAKLASEALSKAKQQLPEGQTTSPDVAKASQVKQDTEDKLADAREKRKQAKEDVKLSEKRRASHQKELERLEKERAKSSKTKSALDDYLAFANEVRALNGMEPTPTDAQTASAEVDCFDDIIGLALPIKPPTPTDISRLRTDASNSTILNEFIVANQVLAPAFSTAKFPACKTSLVRDTDPDFENTVIAAARRRVMSLIAKPELTFGSYEGEGERALLLKTLGLETQAGANDKTDQAGDQALASASPSADEAKDEAPTNILYELVTNEAFPIMAEEMLKPAVMEGLTRFGDEGAQEDFARKLAALSYDEQLARAAHARALDGLDSKGELRYAQLLRARGEMLALMLSSCLLGAIGINRHPVSMENIQKVLTGQPSLTPRGAGKVSAQPNGTQAILVEQIPNAEGSFSFGKSIPLPSERTVIIGRAPFSTEQASIIVPAGISPYPGLANFASNVSRAHALLEPSPEGWRLSDAGSSFGTAVRRLGESLECIELADDDLLLQSGDVIVLAPIVCDDGRCEIDPQYGFSYRYEVM